LTYIVFYAYIKYVERHVPDDYQDGYNVQFTTKNLYESSTFFTILHFYSIPPIIVILPYGIH